MQPQQLGTGAIARPIDKRDYKLGYAAAPIQRPAVYKPDYSSLPVKMQGKYGTCGGHAGGALESLLEMVDLSPKFLWKNIKKGQNLDQDVGTDMRSIFSNLQATGTCVEQLCPNTLDDSFATYSNNASLTDTQKNAAYSHGINNYAFTDNPSWEQICDAIYQFKAVIARVDCGTGWHTSRSGVPSWQEADILPLRLGAFESGHFIVLWGYDENYIYFRNSWSSEWGKNGDGYFDRSYLPHVTEIGTGIDAVTTKQRVATQLTAVVELLKKIVGLLTPHP